MHLDLQLGLAGLGHGAGLAIFAMGLVVIYSGSGVLNFGHGAIATFAAYLFLWLQDEHGWGWYAAFGAGLSVSVAIGLVFYALAMRPLRHAPPLAKVVATLGLLIGLSAALVVIFGHTAPPRVTILPKGLIELPVGSPAFTIGKDRLTLVVIAVLLTVVLALVFRWTRFGLRTRTLADSEVALAVAGNSPDRTAAANWALGCGLAGAAGMLLSGLAPVTAEFYTSLMITAIAAALVGGFRSFGATFGAAFAIGIAQPIVSRHAPEISDLTGLDGWTESLPLIVIIVVFVVRGQGLPSRDLTVTRPLPTVPRPSAVTRNTIIGILVASTWIMFVPRAWVRATSISAIYVLLALSVVIIVGYVGQVSLAQMTFAGAGAFAAASASTELGLPFPLPVLVGGLVAVPAALIFGIPALRVRGINLAVVTLALAIAADNMILHDPDITGGDIGRAIDRPSFLGINLAPLTEPRRWAVVTVLFAAGACLCVARLRKSHLGMRMLATRANERGSASTGVSVMHTKLTAFVLSGFIAGCGGALLAYNFGQIGPASFGTVTSVLLVAYVYLGGIGSLAGAVLAGCIAPFGVVAEVIGIHNDWINLIAGLGIVMMVVLHPSGLAGIPGQVREHLAHRSRGDEGLARGDEMDGGTAHPNGTERISEAV